jgi:hypothetical protein
VLTNTCASFIEVAIGEWLDQDGDQPLSEIVAECLNALRTAPSASAGHVCNLVPALVAERVIQERQVSPGKIRVGFTFLSVEGLWSNMPEPGVLLAFFALLANNQRFSIELAKAFEPQLD